MKVAKLFKGLPFWLKGGLVFGILMTALMAVVPERYTNLAFVPWYLGWLILPAFIIFSILCIGFGIDFVSNYSPHEGPLRHILLPIFSSISIFIVSFILGSLLAFIAGILVRKAKGNQQKD